MGFQALYIHGNVIIDVYDSTSTISPSATSPSHPAIRSSQCTTSKLSTTVKSEVSSVSVSLAIIPSKPSLSLNLDIWILHLPSTICRMPNPTSTNFKAALHVLQYLKSTRNDCIVYKRSSTVSITDIIGYSENPTLATCLLLTAAQ
jgi:hypothetical protein